MWSYQAWIQPELNSALLKAQILEATCTNQTLKHQLSIKISRMQQINLHELPEAVKDITDKYRELRHNGPYEILDDYRYLQDCLLAGTQKGPGLGRSKSAI
jgi:hypothetical protein